MRKLLLAVCLYLMALEMPMAQQFSGNCALLSQSQVDQFNYTEVTGDVIIRGNQGGPITNLTKLSMLTKVGGKLTVSYTNSVDLSFLANLKSVGGDVEINNNDAANIALTNLASAKSIFIHDNALTSSINLPTLTTVGNVVISSNPVLKSINMQKVAVVGGSLEIQRNALLTQLNFSLDSIRGSLTVSENTTLSDCCVFKNLIRTIFSLNNNVYIDKNGGNCNGMLAACSSIPNNALAFDGVDDVVEIGIQTFYGGSFTIEGWIKPQSGALFNIYQGANTAVYAEVTSSKTVRFIVRNPPGNSGGAEIIGKTDVVTDGKWHHFAAVKGDDDFTYLYIDGMPDGKSSVRIGDFTPQNQSFNMRLGMNVTGGERYYKGSMDDIRCWVLARTQDEIKKNMGKSLGAREDYLWACYNFDQGTANDDNKTETTLKNNKGGLNGTLKNFALRGPTSNFTTGAPVQ